MPKERINPSAGESREQYEVQVGWSKDRDVQVGIESSDGTSLLWTLFGGDDNLERIGAELIGMAQFLATSPGPIDGAKTEDDKHDLALSVARDTLNMIESGGAGTYFVSEHGTAFYTGIWSNLDREDCNDLIRVVRRARDQAFGRDE